MNKLGSLLLILTLWFIPHVSAQKIASKKDVEVSIELSEGTLYGSLLIPKGKKPKTVVLLIPGSGPTDRNCNSLMGLNSNSFILIAEALYKEGIATLRVDKRASGKSLPTFKKSLDSIMFLDFYSDALEWIDFLKKDQRFSKVVVAGHSQGSLVGMLAAKNGKADGFISLAGAGRPIDQILYDQLSKSFEYPKEADTLKMFLDSLRIGTYLDDAPKQLKQTLPKNLSAFLAQWIGINPKIEIMKLSCPVAIIQGGHDLQVGVEEAEILHEAKDDAFYLVLPEMNHVLKDAPLDPFANYATYNLPEKELSVGLITGILKFLDDNQLH